MEIRNLITFMHVAELNSFTKAASQLGYSQSTISFQIKQLEDELNCMLFERINHTITLTKTGQELLKYAQNIVNLTEQFKNNLSNNQEVSGFIHIVSPDSICENLLRKNYSVFHQQYPMINLKFSTGDTSDMFDQLNHNEADIIFTLDTHVYDKDYIIAKEESVNTHFVVNMNHPLALKSNISIRDLMEYPFILTEKNMGYRRILDEALSKHSLEVNPVLEISRTDLITELLQDNPRAISFLPDFVTEKAIQKNKLAYLNVIDFKADIWKQLIYHKNKWMSNHLDAFINFMIKNEFK